MTLMSIRGSLLTTTTVVALALVLTGCTTGDRPAASASPSPSPSVGDVVSTAPASASPSPSPSPSDPVSSPVSPAPTAPASSPSPTATGPVVDPDDPASWLVSFDGIGPLVMGGSIAAPVSDALIESADPVATPEACRYFDGDGIDSLVVVGSSEPGLIGGVIASGKEDPAGYPRTSAGIGNGSSEEELLAVYPGAVLADLGGISRSYSITDGSGRYVHFALGEGAIVQGLYVLDGPELPSEFCI